MPGQFLSYVIVCVPSLLAIVGACSPDIPALFGLTNDAMLFEYPFRCPLVLGIKIGVGLCATVFAAWALYRQQHRPFRDFEELRSITLKRTFESPIKKIRRVSIASDLRLNIMRATNFVRIGEQIQIGRLTPVYHYDGAGDRLDGTLRFWYIRFFMYRWAQGACGKAFLDHDTVGTVMDDVRGKEWHLGRKMIEAIGDLKLVISVPIPQIRGKHSFRYVGVINVDSSRADLAETIMDDHSRYEFLEVLFSYLEQSRIFVGRWL